MSILFAIVLGAAWRRWWGSARPSWAFPGYRALQAAAGGLTFVLATAWWAPLPITIIAAVLVVAIQTPVSRLIPQIWDAWEWVQTKTNTSGWYTMAAEATQGAIIWSLGAIILAALRG